MAKKGKAFQQLVGTVVAMMEPGALVTEGSWVRGPDGIRDLDVFVRGLADGWKVAILIECKDWKRPVGIEVVDALESKRRDLAATLAVLASNSGFTQPALAKAGRVGVPAVAVARKGDKRAKAVIRRVVFCRRLKLVNMRSTYSFVESATLDPSLSDLDISVLAQPFANWIRDRITDALTDVLQASTIRIETSFAEGVEFSFGSVVRRVTQHVLEFEIASMWYSKVASLDASAGLYDYISGRMSIHPGGSFHVSGLDLGAPDWEKSWQRLDEPPEEAQRVEQLLRGEARDHKRAAVGIGVQMVFGVVTGPYLALQGPAPDLGAIGATTQIHGDATPAVDAGSGRSSSGG